MILVEQIIVATGPDRELDAQIALAMGLVPEGAFRPCAATDVGTFANGSYGYWTCAPYTGSLDAAMSLVPEGWDWAADGSKGYEGGRASVSEDPGPYLDAVAATPALALCAAALKARAATKGGGA